MNDMRYFIILTVILFLCTPAMGGNDAQEKQPPSVKKVEDYLRDLGTAQARFLQTASDGSQYLGTFYLNRPGKLRFEYDEPVDDFVVADGYFIYFYDSELGEQSNAPIGQTLADFILRPDLKLSGDIAVQNVNRNDGLLQVTLAQAEDPGAGSLTLGFDENPFALRKWRIIDPQGATTEIELFELQTDIDLDRNLFAYHDPKENKPFHFND